MAADTALFIGWGDVKHGYENTALQVFNEAIQLYGKLQQQGQIDSFEAFALEPHGGDLWGFILLRGDLDKLHQVRYSQEFVRITNRASVVVNNIGIITAETGQLLQTRFQNIPGDISDLTHQ